MAWSPSFLLVSALGHAAFIGGGALLTTPGPAVEPDAELFIVDAPEVLEQALPEPEPEPPAPPPEPSPVVPAPVVKLAPPSPDPVPNEPTPPASDNAQEAPEVVTASTDANADGFVMRSGHGSELGSQSPPQRPAPALAPPTPKKPPVAGLFKSWRTRVGLLVMNAAGRGYPDSARRLGNEGTVVLSMAVDSLGRVTSVEVVRSSGHRDLDQAAISTVRGLGTVPAPPPELHAALRPFAVPIAYRLQ